MSTYTPRTNTAQVLPQWASASKPLQTHPPDRNASPSLSLSLSLSLSIYLSVSISLQFFLPRVLPFLLLPLLRFYWSGTRHRRRQPGLMTPPLEHDYIGLSELPSMEASEKLAAPASGFTVEDDRLANLKETELRLGLPGSESPDRKDKDQALLTLGLPKGFVSGAKRGFSDAIDGSGKWVFTGGSGSEVELRKGGGLFSPRGEGNSGQLAGAANGAGKDAVLASKATASEKSGQISPAGNDRVVGHAAKAQVVGWPPIRSYRKNTMAANPLKNSDDPEGKQGSGCLYVKVSMDGAPYLRKVDLKTYCNYEELSSALEKMFSCFTIGQCGRHGVPGRDGLSESHLIDLLHGSEYVLTYEDKDGDWMLVGDVPWDMFTDTCKRLRIMKGSEAIGLAPRAMEKNKNRN